MAGEKGHNGAIGNPQRNRRRDKQIEEWDKGKMNENFEQATGKHRCQGACGGGTMEEKKILNAKMRKNGKNYGCYP